MTVDARGDDRVGVHRIDRRDRPQRVVGSESFRLHLVSRTEHERRPSEPQEDALLPLHIEELGVHVPSDPPGPISKFNDGAKLEYA